MIARILGQVTPILLALLLGVAVFAGMQARQYAAERDAEQARAERAEDRTAILLEHQRWQNEQMATMNRALAERDDRLQNARQLLDLARQDVRDLERDDAETADWAGRDVPGAVRGWVRQLSGQNDDGAGGSDAAGTAAPDEAAGSTGQEGDAQPRSAAAAG